MCKLCLFPPLWLLSWGLGWATAWQAGLARSASLMSQTPTYRIRSRLLTLHVSTLKPNLHAGQSKPYTMRGGHLRLVKRA